MKHRHLSKIRALCLVFLFLSIALFSIAIYVYPGGNPSEKATVSFDLGKNYLCNLYNETAINTFPNPGRLFAIAGLALLSISFAITFYMIPIYLGFSKANKRWTQSFGTFSMVVSFFVFTPWHDSVIDLSGFLGSVSLFIIFCHLISQKEYTNLGLAILALSCCGFTPLIYYSGFMFHVLAITQKISLILFIIWLVHVQLVLHKKKQGT